MSRQPSCEDSDAIGARLRELQAERLAAVARRLALQTNPDQPDYGAVFTGICRTLNVKSLDDMMDNHSIAIMDQALDLVRQWLISSNVAA